MRTTTTLRMSLISLKRNPTRTMLTMLGIIIGIAAVITMMEIGNGSKTSIRNSIEKMGANSVMVMPGSMRPPGGARVGAGNAVSLIPADADAIGSECPSVGAYSPVVRGNGIHVVFGNVDWEPGNIYGIAPAYLDIRAWSIAEGRAFTNAEVDANARVCLVGSTIVKEVFGGMSPLGCELRIGEVTFEVVGVLNSKGANMMGMDEDDCVFTPWTTLRMRVTGLKYGSASNTSSTIADSPGSKFAISGLALYPEPDSRITRDHLFYSKHTQLNQIIFSAVSVEKIPDATREVSQLLRKRHRLKVDQEDDFRVFNSSDFMNMLNQTSTLMTNLLLGVALLSLLVGGVGIMNIMLVSVTERTREIGLRMAVGARSRDILKQFLIESVVLCLSGGIIGILLGHGMSLLIEKVARWPIGSSPEAVVAAVLVSASVGILFGFYPAWKASKLDPIEALRYE
ncbi:MAG: FtsX-like permease family protein [Lentisphaerae bacterium]|nr:FtsX-like permease family protein [Lentisphaerota bacterium]